MASQPEIPLQYMSGLEPAQENFPEVSRRESRAPEVAYYYNQNAYHPHAHPHHHPYPSQVYQSYPNLPIPPKPDDPYGSQIPLAGVGSPFPYSPNSQTAVLSQSGGATIHQASSHKKILGCTRLVFFLSCAIALLSAAVISLAAMTGIESARASDFEKRAATLSASLASATGPTATVTVDSAAQATSFPVLTNGCSDDPEGTTGKTYTTFSLLGQQKFTMSCNKDTINPPVLSLFASSFQTCMDACSAYSKYMPGIWGENELNATCVAVSFIPLWTVKQNAEDGGAPGNCYLKPGPMGLDDLKPANIGTECHSALLVDQT